MTRDKVVGGTQCNVFQGAERVKKTIEGERNRRWEKYSIPCSPLEIPRCGRTLQKIINFGRTLLVRVFAHLYHQS